MKHQKLLPILFLFSFIPVSGQIISQYIETSSGSIPKGIEIWNNTTSELNFVTNNLVIEKGTNGAIPSIDFTINTGTLTPGKVIVVGTSDMQTITENNGSSFFSKAFSFNGNDALVVKYGGIISDVFGVPGTDPVTAWTGYGVSTANQNIALKTGITTGNTDGWTDPSSRFETISTDNSQTGFGLAPLPPVPSITVNLTTLSDFKYLIAKGPSSSQSFIVNGIWLTNNIMISPPASYEISTNNISFQNTAINITQSGGTVYNTTIYTRLKSGLEEGVYNEDIDLTSTGVSSKKVSCSGCVSPVPNAWINEFHYDNIGTDMNEFVEIVIKDASDYNLADFNLSLYNGGDGTFYNSQTLNNFTIGQTLNSFSFFIWTPSSIQNGPDGFSLNYLDSILLFISYEGVFTATNGPATGLKSTNVNGTEGSSTLVGYSLQLYGSGSEYSHFRWNAHAETPGLLNAYQIFGKYVPPVPVDFRIILLLFLSIFLATIFRKLKK